MNETGKFDIGYYDQNWQKRETVVEFTPAINELIKCMKCDRSEGK